MRVQNVLALFVAFAICLALTNALAVHDTPKSAPEVITDPDLSYDEQQAYTAWRRLEHTHREKIRAKRAAKAKADADAAAIAEAALNKPEILVVTPGVKLGSVYRHAIVDDPLVSRSMERILLRLTPPKHRNFGSSVFDRIQKPNEEIAKLVKKLPEEPFRVIRKRLPQPVHTPVYEAPTGPLTVKAKLDEQGTIVPVSSQPLLVPMP